MPRITKLDIERFTCGDCHLLAREIARVTGWAVCSFAYADDDEPDIHAFVQAPNGDLIDIEGRWTPEALLTRWGKVFGPDIQIIQTTFAEIVRCWWKDPQNPDYGRYSLRRARQLAPHLAGISVDKTKREA